MLPIGALTQTRVSIVRCPISSSHNYGNPTFPCKDHWQNNYHTVLNEHHSNPDSFFVTV